MELDYIVSGDYLLSDPPDALAQGAPAPLGSYGELHKRYLR